MDDKVQMFANRMRKNFRHLHKQFERQQVGAFRLYDRDIPEIRIVADWYEGHLVLGEYARTQTDAQPGYLAAMAQGAAEALSVPPEKLHLKRRKTRPVQGARYEKLAAKGERLPVREGSLRFLVNLDDYLDTGLFNDHRQTRARLAKECAGKSFLNLFGYTGSFTCAAAQGGARETVTVDTSSTYLRWAQDNLVANGLWGGQHELAREDAREYLERAARSGRRFERCLLDPPSFSTRETGPGLDVQRDHRSLIESALRVIAPGGALWFSTNHQRFEPQLNGLGSGVREITAETTPPDYRGHTPHRCFVIGA